MLTRILSSAVAGLAITAALFYLMHYLIDISQAAVEPRPPYRLAPLGRTIDDTAVAVSEKRPDRIPPPEVLPRLLENTDTEDPVTGIRILPMAAEPTAKWRQPSVFGYTDGALITIITVRPNYPAAASSRGTEGFVVVQFDVTEMGTVTNVTVVESSSRLFNKSAIDAVMKFRFKPQVIDGMAQVSYGVRRLFTFEMEKN